MDSHQPSTSEGNIPSHQAVTIDAKMSSGADPHAENMPKESISTLPWYRKICHTRMNKYDAVLFVTSYSLSPKTLYILRLVLAFYMIVTQPLGVFNPQEPLFTVNKSYWFHFAYFTNLSWYVGFTCHRLPVILT
jgi:hypothetical protein